jgi:hypothetical protein
VPRGAEGVTKMRMKPAARRNLIRTSIAMAVYLAGVVAATYLIERQGVSGLLAFGLALVPGIAMAGMFWSSGKTIAETEDEFMRMLAVRQHLIAAGFAMSVASVWGMLEMFKLVEHVNVFFIVVPWAIGIFIGMVVNRVTHGVWGQCL